MIEFITHLPQTLRADPLVAVPGDILFLLRTMGLLNGLARALDSRVDLKMTLLPYAAAGMAEGDFTEALASVE